MTQSPLFLSNNAPLPIYTGCTNHQSLYSNQEYTPSSIPLEQEYTQGSIPGATQTQGEQEYSQSSQVPTQQDYSPCSVSDLNTCSEPSFDRFFTNSTQFRYDSDSAKNNFEFKESLNFGKSPPNSNTSKIHPEPYSPDTFKISSASCGNSTESLTGTSSILRMGSGKHTSLPGSRVRFSRVYSVQSESNLGRIKETGVERTVPGGTVILNVGGSINQVKWETIDKFPKSRLQRLRYAVTEAEILSLCDSFSLGTREFFFDRSPRIFENILGLYRKGELHLTESVCPRDFLGELEYWGLSALHLEPCCAYTMQRASWLLPIADHGVDQEDEINPFEGMCCAKLRNTIWKLFEYPNSSRAAKVLVIVSSMFLLASIIMLILSTVPEFQEFTRSVDTIEEKPNEEENYFFRVTEAIFVGWFTLEYLIRFIVAPHKMEFLVSFLNIIDLLGILPFYFSLVLNLLSSKYSIEYIAKAAQIFRILRILRIFKLSRHITGLKTLGTTLRNSHRELLLLSMTVSMGMLIFAGLAYALEKDEPNTMFYTLPQTLYWAIITMTSTGYGDISPKTAAGKLVASLCAICGVLCITLPIPIIVANFNRYYEKSIIEQEIGEQRAGTNLPNWAETKRNIREARYRLSLRTESLENSLATHNGSLNGNRASSATSMTYLSREDNFFPQRDVRMELMTP